jgi:hypothetical protein
VKLGVKDMSAVLKHISHISKNKCIIAEKEVHKRDA